MDVMAVSEEDEIFDAEFQRSSAGASPKRARFNSSIMDANLPLKGIDTNKLTLPDTYVIFITESDILGEGRPIYHIERTILESGRAFGDGAHIIYVNGAYDDTSTQLGRLIHDLRCPRADDMFFQEFSERTRDLKDGKKETVSMSSELEKLH